MSELPYQYRQGYKAAAQLMQEHPWLEREEVRAEAALYVAECLARGQTRLRTKFILGALRARCVLAPLRRRSREIAASRNEASPAERFGAVVKKRRRCTKHPGAAARCHQCKLERQARHRARVKAGTVRTRSTVQEGGVSLD